MSKMSTQMEEVQSIISKVRPYIQRDGGDIEILKIEDGVVYVRMSGACNGCMALDITLKHGIENMLLETVPGIIGVVNV